MKQFEKMFNDIDGFMNNLIKYLCIIIPSYFNSCNSLFN